MKIQWFLILLCLITIISTYGEQLNEYSFEIINKIKVGSKEGMIGWQFLPGGITGPATLFVSNDEIFVPDRMNYRVNIYDLDIKFKRTLMEKGKNEVSATYIMKMDDNGNIIYISTISGLIKIDSNGNRLFSIDYKILPRKVKNQYNFFPIEDNIFIYNDNNEIECITAKGETLQGKNVKSKIDKITSKRMSDLYSGMKLPSDKIKIIEDFQQDNTFLVINDHFYSTDFYKIKEYFNKIKEVRSYILTQKKGNMNKNIDLNIDDFSMHFIGYDTKYNSYWQGSIDKPGKIQKYAIIIYSKYGELLDAFYYGQYDDHEPNYSLYPTTEALIAVAPDGDVYFLIGNSKEYTFYKVENNW